MWVSEYHIEISVSGTKDGNLYDVSEADLEVCLELEKHFEVLGWLPMQV